MEVHRLSSPTGKLAVKSKQWSEKGSVGLRTGSSLPATRSHYTLPERTAANQHAAASHLYSMRYMCILLYTGVCQFTHEVMNSSLRTMWVLTSARTEPWTRGLMIGRVGSEPLPSPPNGLIVCLIWTFMIWALWVVNLTFWLLFHCREKMFGNQSRSLFRQPWDVSE